MNSAMNLLRVESQPTKKHNEAHIFICEPSVTQAMLNVESQKQEDNCMIPPYECACCKLLEEITIADDVDYDDDDDADYDDDDDADYDDDADADAEDTMIMMMKMQIMKIKFKSMKTMNPPCRFARSNT